MSGNPADTAGIHRRGRAAGLDAAPSEPAELAAAGRDGQVPGEEHRAASVALEPLPDEARYEESVNEITDESGTAEHETCQSEASCHE